MVGSLIVSPGLGLTTLTCSHMPCTQAPHIQHGEEPGYDMIATHAAVLQPKIRLSHCRDTVTLWLNTHNKALDTDRWLFF